MPTIYDIDYELQADNLNAPIRRKARITAFIYSLMNPLQWLRDFFFYDYVNGSSYLDYDPIVTYIFGDRIIWIDKCIYEAIYIDANEDPQSFSGVLPSNTIFWQKLNETFIGVNERTCYNSQRLIFEYALNRFFRVSPTPAYQIYIQNNFIISGNNFVMGNDGSTSSYMPNDSSYQGDYMGSIPTYNPLTNDYTIFVPVAIFTALGTNTTNRENAVRNFADLYNTIGMQYDIQTY